MNDVQPKQPPNIEDARFKKQQSLQVYQCGHEECKAQAHVLHKGGGVFCNGCNNPSGSTWYIPDTPPGSVRIRRPREKFLRTIGVDGLACGYCSSIHFHLVSDYSVQCFRCKKPNFVKFFFPGQGVQRGTD